MDKNELQRNQNEDFHQLEIAELRKKLVEIKLGGGKSRIEKHKAKGKLTARERIRLLLDKDTYSFEVGAFAGDEMYKEHGGCPSGGVVVVIGKVEEREVIIVANDATVKAGAWFPITAKKTLRAQEIALRNKIPIIYLVDSAGAYLPMQDEVFADKDHFGRIFRNNALMNSEGVIQISAIMGDCVAGGAYLPAMCDESLIVEGTGTTFLAGSYLVKAAIGEEVDNQTLGGADTHSDISGVTDYKCKNDEECLSKIRKIIGGLGQNQKRGFNRVESFQPKTKTNEILEIFPSKRTEPYNTLELIKCLVDNSEIEEYKETFGKTMICAYARIDGWKVGIVANQRKIIKKDNGELQFGGVIYSDSARKTAKFISICNQKKIPLVFLHDVTGFMVGSRSEKDGIITHGAKLINALSNCVVPKFSIVMGNSYGAGNYAMCGRAYDPNLMVSWPTGKIAVMGGEQASEVLAQIKTRGKSSPEEVQKVKEEIKSDYDKQTSAYYAAARLWTDAIINPTETRKVISLGIQMADNNPSNNIFKVGVYPT